MLRKEKDDWRCPSICRIRCAAFLCAYRSQHDNSLLTPAYIEQVQQSAWRLSVYSNTYLIIADTRIDQSISRSVDQNHWALSKFLAETCLDCGLARMWVLEDSGRLRKKSHRTAEGVQCCTLNWLHTCNFDLFAWSREPISLQVSESVRSFDYLSNLSPTILKATITLATTMGTQCAFTLFCMISISLNQPLVLDFWQ